MEMLDIDAREEAVGELKKARAKRKPREKVAGSLGEEFGRQPRDKALAAVIEKLKADDAELEAEERRLRSEHESDLVCEIENVEDLMKAEGGRNAYAVSGSSLSPKVEQAVRLYAINGEEIRDIAARCCIDYVTLKYALESPAGRAIIAEVRGALDTKFQGLFNKVITVVSDGLDHPDPSVALASAKLWLRHNKATEVKVSLTAEDIVQRLIAGEEIPDV